MLFKVTYRKVLPWIFSSLFAILMLIFGAFFIWAFFDSNNLEPGFRGVKDALPMLIGGILMCAFSIALLIGLHTMSKDVLEVYPDHFIVKRKGREDWKIDLKDVTLKYGFRYENGGSGIGDDIEVYCLKKNKEPIQEFSNNFKNIYKLYDFCIENHVKAVPPATWEECRKQIFYSIL